MRGSNRSNDEEHFSDDSLEESFPPPPLAATTPSKRNSIAWEVSLDGDDPLLTPGSTKVGTWFQINTYKLPIFMKWYSESNWAVWFKTILIITGNRPTKKKIWWPVAL